MSDNTNSDPKIHGPVRGLKHLDEIREEARKVTIDDGFLEYFATELCLLMMPASYLLVFTPDGVTYSPAVHFTYLGHTDAWLTFTKRESEGSDEPAMDIELYYSSPRDLTELDLQHIAQSAMAFFIDSIYHYKKSPD